MFLQFKCFCFNALFFKQDQLKELGEAEQQSKLQKLISNNKIAGTSATSQKNG